MGWWACSGGTQHTGSSLILFQQGPYLTIHGSLGEQTTVSHWIQKCECWDSPAGRCLPWGTGPMVGLPVGWA